MDMEVLLEWKALLRTSLRLRWRPIKLKEVDTTFTGSRGPDTQVFSLPISQHFLFTFMNQTQIPVLFPEVL